MESWRTNLLYNPPKWSEFFSKEEFEHIVMNELLEGPDLDMCSKAGKTSAIARRERNEPIGILVNTRERQTQICRKGARVKGKNKGSSWWKNGSEFKFTPECPGINWEKSSAPNNPGKSTAGTFWWNNGSINKRSRECPGLEWALGRI